MTTLLNLDPSEVPSNGQVLAYDAASTKWLPVTPSGGGSGSDVTAYGAVGDGVELTDAATNSGSAVLTSASASFTQDDVGKTLWILTPTFQATTIASVQSSTSLTMSNVAAATGTGRTVNYGTNNATALTAAVNAAKAGGGQVRFPAGLFLTGSPLPALLHQRDFGFVGEGGQGMSYGTYGTSKIARTELRYMGTTGPFIDAYLTKGTRISGMAIRYANPGFTGYLLKAESTWGTYLDHFLLGGVWEGKNATLIDGRNTVECYLTNGLMERAAYGFRAGGASHANANMFTRVVFLGLDVAASDLMYGTSFVSCVFEPKGGSMTTDPLGGPSPVIGTCHGLTFTACQWWDALGGAGAWIDISGTGLSIHGGFWEPRGADDLIKLNGAFDGVTINGLHGHGIGGGKMLTLAAGASVTGLDVTSVSLDGSVNLKTGLDDIPLTSSVGFSPARGHFALRERGGSGAALTLSRDAVQTVTLDDDCTLSMPAVPATVAAEIKVYLIQDVSGGHAVTWPASVVWMGGVEPTFVTTAGSASEVRLTTVDGGVTWFAELIGDFVAPTTTTTTTAATTTTTTTAATTTTTTTTGGSPITDDFERADSSTTLGAPWEALVGTWGITSGEARSVSGDIEDKALIDTGSDDHEVVAVIGSGKTAGPDDRFAVVARCTAATTHYMTSWEKPGASGTGTLYLWKRVSGTFTVLGSKASMTPLAAGDSVGVKVQGTAISASVNGVTEISATDSDIPTGGKGGIRWGAAGSWYVESITLTPL